MGYFLRKDKKKKGLYLQMYETYWVKGLKQPRSRCIETFGYAEDLVSDKIPDPVEYYTELVREREKERIDLLEQDIRLRAFEENAEKTAGHFLLKSLINDLGVETEIDEIAGAEGYTNDLFTVLTQVICARVVSKQ